MTQIIHSSNGGGGGGVDEKAKRGKIEGTLSDQTDLNAELLTKATASADDTGNEPTGNPGDIFIDVLTDEVEINTVDGWKKMAQKSDLPTKVSDLSNDSGFITSSSIGTANLTIQQNGNTKGTFNANATEGVTANIIVPTNTGDLNNNSGFITKEVNNLTYYTKSSDLKTVATSGKYTDLTDTGDVQTVSNMVTSLDNADDTHYPTAKTVADAMSGAGLGDMLKATYDPTGKNSDAFNYNNMYNKPSVINNLTSTSTTDTLSAYQGKVLKDEIDLLEARGHFLSNWNATTGLPVSFPLATPYTYSTGDYYIVTVKGDSNKRPTGSSYNNVASTVAETEELDVGDVYTYDGTVWLLQVNHGKSVSFANLSGEPTDNTNLSNALSGKADTSLSNLTTQGESKLKQSSMGYFLKEDVDYTVNYNTTKGVAPYSTSYGYTEITITNTDIKEKLGATYQFSINTKPATTTYRNVRVRFGEDGEWYGLGAYNTVSAGYAYFAKAQICLFVLKESISANTTSKFFSPAYINTTYSGMSVAEATTGTATSSRVISASVLKGAIETHAPVQQPDISGFYTKPADGIPQSDLSNEVQISLGKADTALQGFTESDPIFSASAASGITSTNISSWNSKQDAISDLSTIRSGASAGATAMQPATGGTTGQVLTKTDSGYDWEDASGGISSTTVTNAEVVSALPSTPSLTTLYFITG